MQFSIVIPTSGRQALLEVCLNSIAALRVDDYSAELLVVVNGSLADSEAMLGGRRFPFPARVIRCMEAGKNRALNAGFAIAAGDWFVVWDDDVVVPQNYFSELMAGLSRWPSADCVGGPVSLRWPAGLDRALDPHVIRYVRGFAFASLSPDRAPEGEVKSFPFLGSNLVIRRAALSGREPFDPGSGPAPGAYRMGGMAPLLRTFEEAGKSCVFLPSLGVEHVVRPDQMEMEWILRRAHSWGRSLACFGNRFHDLDGTASSMALRRKLFLRRARWLRMMLKKNRYPADWARIDIAILQGMLAERNRAVK